MFFMPCNVIFIMLFTVYSKSSSSEVSIIPRKKKTCFVDFLPTSTYFKPAGIPLIELDEENLTVEELEALRLKDLEGLDQEQCAKQMQIARTTFQRVLYSAHLKVAAALVEGKSIRIEGGRYKMPACRRFKCSICSHEFEVPFANGVRGVDMVCPSCGKGPVHRMSSVGETCAGNKRCRRAREEKHDD